MKGFLWLTLLIPVGLCNSATAQEAANNGGDSKASSDAVSSRQEFLEQLKVHYHKHASAYVFGSGKDESKPFRIEPKPILTWTSTGDPLRSGDVFDRACEGRPQVIGCVGSWPIGDSTRGVFEELHSLSAQPLDETDLEASLKWRSETPGVELKEIPHAAVPADDVRRRLNQMRRVTDRLKASMAIKDGTEELRLLTQPLMEFKAENQNVQFGAVFAFATGTNPAMLLILQIAESAEGRRWMYGPVHMTALEVTLTNEGKSVWKGAAQKPSEVSIWGYFYTYHSSAIK